MTCRQLVTPLRILLRELCPFTEAAVPGGRTFSSGVGHPPTASPLHGTRSIVKLKGADTWRFLQGLVTNDVNKLRDAEGCSIMYTAILNPQGRCLYDLLLHKQSDPASVWLDVEKAKAAEIVTFLQRYKLRSKVDLLNVSDSYTVWAGLSGSLPTSEGWVTDPRLPDLGQRVILPADHQPDGTPVPDEVYTERRFRLGVAEGSSEIPSGAALPLEYNLDALNGVSFSKGCYVGQELTARTHFQGVIRKRLMPLRLLGGAGSPVKAGDKVTIHSGGSRSVGTVNAVLSDGSALGLMRLEAVGRALAGEVQLVAGDGGGVTPVVPGWWPPEWMDLAAEAPSAE